jgi:hypothetical protein
MPPPAISLALPHRPLLHGLMMGFPFLLGHELTFRATAEPKGLLRLLAPAELLVLLHPLLDLLLVFLSSAFLNVLLGLGLSLLPRRCLGTCQGGHSLRPIRIIPNQIAW